MKKFLSAFLLSFVLLAVLTPIAYPAYPKNPAFSRPGGGARRHRPPRPDGIRPGSLHFVRVASVAGGDAILVTFFNGARPELVKMIGVETPDAGPRQNYAKEASDFTTTMLSNRDVWLQFDAQPRDRHRRLMAYVWTEKPRDKNDEEEIRWQMFNARLILDGYARAAASRPNSRYARLFMKFQREAREENRGLWWPRGQ